MALNGVRRSLRNVSGLLLLLFLACSSSKDRPPAPGSASEPAAAPAARDSSPRGLCERGCTKVIDCAGAAPTEIAPCVAACVAGSPQEAQIEQIEAMTCEQLGGATGQRAGAPPANGACTADCRNCAGDDTSCYSIAGGANGIPCDPCCCAPGGPSPTWRTE